MILILAIMSWASLSCELLHERWLAGQDAQRSLIRFAQITAPLASDPLNVRKSQYKAARHHFHIAAALERVERGEIKRLMISIPYRHGKTELAVRKFVPWYMGNDPARSVICITHTDSLGWEHGRDVRNCFQSAGYRLAFNGKKCRLRDDSQARDRLQLEGGGMAMFTGRGGVGGGFGSDLIIFDDFFKNAEEARSKAVRDHAYECYVSDSKSRLNEESGAIIMVGTRKNEDDVQGRILDPKNPHYDPKEAGQWTIIRLPALAEENDPLGREEDAPLWPERFSYDFWNDQRTSLSELVRQDFDVQGQCNPTPAQGTFFRAEWLVPYGPRELPKELKHYAGSDHAVRTKNINDQTCLIPAGVDAEGDLWILPDVWWDRKTTDLVVGAMVEKMLTRHYLGWFAGRDHITGSIGPFLNKAMREAGAYCAIYELTDTADKQAKAQPIQGRMAQRRVHFPVFAPWWGAAREQLMSFPNGGEDDFVDALANIGRGMDMHVKAERPGVPSTGLPKPGTLAWVKGQNDKTALVERVEKARKGW